MCVGARNRIQIQTAPAVEAELRIVNRINAAYPGAVTLRSREDDFARSAAAVARVIHDVQHGALLLRLLWLLCCRRQRLSRGRARDTALLVFRSPSLSSLPSLSLTHAHAANTTLSSLPPSPLPPFSSSDRALSPLLSTPTQALREAINVHPLEFVYAKHLAKLPPGVLLLSEFTGFARVLNGCLRVNPNSQVEMVEMLDTALQMDPVEREARAAKDVTHIGRCTLEAFAYRFIAELKSTATKREEDFVCVGFGLSKFRLVGMGAGFKPLDTSDTVDRFQRASRRAVLLDWGTIAPASSAGFYDQRASPGFSLPQNVLDALAALCADPNCHVMILSGLPKAKCSRRLARCPTCRSPSSTASTTA